MFVKQQSNRPEEVSLSAQNTRVVMVRANVGLSYLLFCFVCDVFLSLVLFLTETVWCLISLLVSNVRDEGSEITKYKQILTTVVLSKKKKSIVKLYRTTSLEVH